MVRSVSKVEDVLSAYYLVVSKCVKGQQSIHDQVQDSLMREYVAQSRAAFVYWRIRSVGPSLFVADHLCLT